MTCSVRIILALRLTKFSEKFFLGVKENPVCAAELFYYCSESNSLKTERMETNKRETSNIMSQNITPRKQQDQKKKVQDVEK